MNEEILESCACEDNVSKDKSNGYRLKNRFEAMLLFPGEEVSEDKKIYYFECDKHRKLRREEFLAALQSGYDEAAKKIRNHNGRNQKM